MATPVIMPRQGQSVESCILVEWTVQPGDDVTEGQTLASIETDKAVFEVEAPTAGTVLALFREAGDDVPVLETIAAIGEAGEDVSDLAPSGGGEAPAEETSSAAAEAPAETGQEEAETSPPPTPSPSAPAPQRGSSTGVSPRARKRAAERGVDTTGLSGSGPGGRIIERDIPSAPAAAAPSAAAAMPAEVPRPAGVEEDAEDIPLQGIRRIIASRMRASLANTAQLTLTRTADATALLAFRKQIKERAGDFGLPNISVNDMLVYAALRTLARHPDLNAHVLGDRIRRFPWVNCGIAVDTPRGLMVPVIKGADRLSLKALSETIAPLAESCRTGSVNPDDLEGGTFTITNLGALGVEQFTPVLNAPEAAILGIGGLHWKPVQREGEIVHVQALHLSLTIDHQAVDGAPGARYLADVADAIEQFDLLLAG